ncbi:hypothetical protein G7046_g9907 [Stylonectria norvegica]|nr:hypothetical protein G7046_g9907 [Stylonectria norvegica]
MVRRYSRVHYKNPQGSRSRIPRPLALIGRKTASASRKTACDSLLSRNAFSPFIRLVKQLLSTIRLHTQSADDQLSRLLLLLLDIILDGDIDSPLHAFIYTITSKPSRLARIRHPPSQPRPLDILQSGEPSTPAGFRANIPDDHSMAASNLPEVVPPDLPARPWPPAGGPKVQQHTAATRHKRNAPQFYVPALSLPGDNTDAVHKIHILGDDVRSRFIAHALSGVYDSVELLGLQKHPSSKYVNFEKARPGIREPRTATKVERNAAVPKDYVEDSTSHIKQLVVGGSGFEAVSAVETIKHRVDENTSICLMNDGMGVLEDIREQIFKGEKQPNFYLGHMSHALAFNRNRDSVRELKGGMTLITRVPNPTAAELSVEELRELKDPLIHVIEHVKGLNAVSGTYSQWLRFKLPSMIFTAAVDPVCVLLDLSYKDLLNNRSGLKMVNQLLQEIILVVSQLPEIQNTEEVRAYIEGKAIHKLCFQRLMAKGRSASHLLQQVKGGNPIDINYQNGYFLRRAKRLGIDIPLNTMLFKLVHAKRQDARAKRDAWIEMEEAPGPTGLRTSFPYPWQEPDDMPLQNTPSPRRWPTGLIRNGILVATNPNNTMADSELDAIRKARLEQLKAGGSSGGPSSGGGGQQDQQQQNQQKQEEQRQSILNQILHPEAADRLGRIRLVKESRAADVENRLITLAQTGQLRSKVTEAQLKELLNAMADNQQEEKIVVSRRKGWDDDDDDDFA